MKEKVHINSGVDCEKVNKRRRKFNLLRRRMDLENINPNVYKKSDARAITKKELDENLLDPIDSREIFGKENNKAEIYFNY